LKVISFLYVIVGTRGRERGCNNSEWHYVA